MCQCVAPMAILAITMETKHVPWSFEVCKYVVAVV